MRILIVDSCRGTRALYRAVLAGLGLHEVEECAGGAETADALGSCSPDMLIVDDSRPGVDALGLVRRVRSEGPTSLIIMTSRDESEASVVRAIRAGADEYLVRPFTPDLLSQRIEEALMRSERTRRYAEPKPAGAAGGAV